eukprot:XP_011441006.1 PREDICTED: uncharacterized protein LOC105337799 isoform X2 [Crassostrea gigas]
MRSVFHGFLFFSILGSAPKILGFVIDVQASICDPPLLRNSSSVVQTISIKSSTKSCQWTIQTDTGRCLQISSSPGADQGGAYLGIVDENETEGIRPFVNTTVCSSQVSVNYRGNQTEPGTPGTERTVYYLAVPRHRNTEEVNDVITTTTSAGNTNDSGGTSPAVIAVSVSIPLILIGIGACLVYVWYRRKYPVRMIVGKDFSKFSNPAYNKRSSTATLVRENAAIDDDYRRDIEEGAAYTGVAHDNPALNMEDDPQYQPIPSLTHSMPIYDNYRRSFEDSPQLQKKAPEKPKRLYSSEHVPFENGEEEDASTKGKKVATKKIESDDNKTLYENVENKTTKIKRKESLKSPDDVTDQESLVGNGHMTYEDVTPSEDDHLYETTITGSTKASQKSESSTQPTIKSEPQTQRSVESESSTQPSMESESEDEFPAYENVAFKDDGKSSVEENVCADSSHGVSLYGPNHTSDSDDVTDDEATRSIEPTEPTNLGESFQIVSSASELIEEQPEEKTRHEAADQSTIFISRDQSFPESFSSDSFVVLNESEAHESENEDEKKKTKVEHIPQESNSEIDLKNSPGKAEDTSDDEHAPEVDVSEHAQDAVTDISFDTDVDHLNISVSSISDPDVKSCDSAFSFVSHDLKSVDESSDSFEVISNELVHSSDGNVKANVNISAEPMTAEKTTGEVLKETNIVGNPDDKNSLPSSKTIESEMMISHQDSNERENSDKDEISSTEEKEILEELSNIRRESSTRKIALDHGTISFDDSASSSPSQSDDSDEEIVEVPKPSLVRRESITLDNPAFDSPNINISLKFTSDEMSDNPEPPRGLTRRKSITLDNPLFEKDSEISKEPESSPLDSFHVIEAEPLDEPISEESENEAHDTPEVELTVPQKKVLKISMDIGNDDDEGSSSPEEDSNSEPDSSTEA